MIVQVETKFNVGDIVGTYIDGKLAKGVVHSIKVVIKKDSIDTMYHLTDLTIPTMKMYFPTRSLQRY
jgi:hypothetical protein